MNDVQLNKLAMYRKVIIFGNTHSDDLITVTQIAQNMVALQGIVTSIDEADTTATEDSTGIAETKENYRTLLETFCRRCSRSLEVYAIDNNNFVMRRIVDVNPSQLTGMRDDKLLQAAKMLYGKATPVVTDLLGITAADLAVMAGTIENYEELLAAPDEKIGEKSAYGGLVDELFEQGEVVMEKLRAYVALFEDTNTLVYDAFISAASIDDTGSSNNTVSGTVDGNGNKTIAPLTYDAAAEVKLESTGTTVLEFTISFNGTEGSNAVTVQPGASVIKTFGEMAASGDNLKVHNTHATVSGAYKATFL